MQKGGAVACGHAATTAAAAEILDDGGNAVDAAIAAALAACVAEPVLASLGGGGFLLVHRTDGAQRLFDGFAQTPQRTHPEALIHPIEADFGPARQTFHIGPASAAVPGLVAGLHAAYRWGGSLPFARLVAPAERLARAGVVVNALQAYLFAVVRPILEVSEEVRQRYSDTAAGVLLRQPELADTLEALGREGPALFYDGEIAAATARLCQDLGGHLTRADFEHYRSEARTPLIFRYRSFEVATNPPPSAGGALIGFALSLLEDCRGTPAEILEALAQANAARHEIHAGAATEARLAAAREAFARRQLQRGTTQVSVVDGAGGAVSATLSNGEGCGHMIPGTGIMLNNMLGEDDINPEGIGAWEPNVRLGSMMAPTLAMDREALWALGSGGSNRIRSAIVQVLKRLLDGVDPDRAVAAPRLHLEDALVSLEPGFSAGELDKLPAELELHQWEAQNLFFGGVHVVGRTRARRNIRYVAVGDARRGGASVTGA